MKDPRETLYKRIGTLQRLSESGLLEIAYKGNVGLHELVRFYDLASKDEVDRLESLLKTARVKEAWDLIQRVTQTSLAGISYSPAAATGE